MNPDSSMLGVYAVREDSFLLVHCRPSNTSPSHRLVFGLV